MAHSPPDCVPAWGQVTSLVAKKRSRYIDAHGRVFTRGPLPRNLQTRLSCQVYNVLSIAEVRTDIKGKCHLGCVLSFHPVNGDGYPERSFYENNYLDRSITGERCSSTPASQSVYALPG